MRNLSTSHWEDISKLQGLLYFSQLVDEMLFDYTLDSYKPRALNSRLLCIEALSTMREINDGFVPQKNIQSVLEELKWSLKKDVAAKRMLGAKYQEYFDRIKPNDIKLYEVKTIVEYLKNTFSRRKYLNQIIECLKEYIHDGKEKEKISSLTGSFLTELINQGYHPNHIYYQNSKFFFDSTKRSQIKSADDLNQFFELFDFEPGEFTVVFIGGIIFRDFRDTLNVFDVVVTKNYRCFSRMDDDINFKESRSESESFVICSNIKSLDHHSARERAESILGQISGLFNFYHHKEKPIVKDKCVVRRKEGNFVVIIDKPTKSILKTKVDFPSYIAAKKVDETFKSLKLERESMYRYFRSIELHSAAIISNTLENQLLDLWAALETLLPKNSKSNKDRIVQICDSLVPFLQVNYIHKQLEELYRDIAIWNKDLLEEVLGKITNSEKFSKNEQMGILIAFKTSKNLRELLYEKLEDFPLLKHRIYQLHLSLNSPENIEKTLNSHYQKVNWHLRRIYRTRGLIIHSGKYPTYTTTLVENLHNYLDIFIKKIVDLSKDGTIMTIEQGTLEVETSLVYQLKLLEKHKGEELSTDNFQEALLGGLSS
jgi:hypothetical protein